MKTITEINGFNQFQIGGLKFFLPVVGLSLSEMAKKIGFDLQSRVVLDYENEFNDIMKIATEFKTVGNAKYPVIITKSIFKK